MDKLKKLLEEQGASLVAYSDVSEVIEAKGFPFAITIGYKLNTFIMQGVKDEPTYEYFHHYRTVNAKLDQLALFAATYIEKLGYMSYMIPASQSSITDKYVGAFPHKTAAVLSGSGYIGKNALFISTEFGSAIRLATVLTNYPLNAKNNIIQNGCGSCRICVDKCPAGAIGGSNYVYGEPRSTIFDAEKCSQHMKRAYQHIGRGAVCGVCITCCPSFAPFKKQQIK